MWPSNRPVEHTFIIIVSTEEETQARAGRPLAQARTAPRGKQTRLIGFLFLLSAQRLNVVITVLHTLVPVRI